MSENTIEVDQVIADPRSYIFVSRKEASSEHPVLRALGTLSFRALYRDQLFHLEGDQFVTSVLSKRFEKQWPELLAQVKMHGQGYPFGYRIDPQSFDALLWCRAICWHASIRAYDKHQSRVDRAANLRISIEEQIASARIKKSNLPPSPASAQPLDTQIRTDLTVRLRPLKMSEFQARRLAASGQPLLHVHLLGQELIIAEVGFEGFDGYGIWRTADGIVSGAGTVVSEAGVRIQALAPDQVQALLSSTRKMGFIAKAEMAKLVAAAEQIIASRVKLHMLSQTEPWIAIEHEKLAQRLEDLKARCEIVRTAKARSQAKLTPLLRDMAGMQRHAVKNACIQAAAATR